MRYLLPAILAAACSGGNGPNARPPAIVAFPDELLGYWSGSYTPSGRPPVSIGLHFTAQTGPNTISVEGVYAGEYLYGTATVEGNDIEIPLSSSAASGSSWQHRLSGSMARASVGIGTTMRGTALESGTLAVSGFELVRESAPSSSRILILIEWDAPR